MIDGPREACARQVVLDDWMHAPQRRYEHVQDDPGAGKVLRGVKAGAAIRSMAGAAALALVGACATAPDETTTGFAPPAVGTETDWTFTYADGAREDVTSRVIAAGDDFAIWLADTRLAADEPYHFYAEFAGGLFYTPCDKPMPTSAARAAALNLWPPSPGATADVGGEVRIGERDSVMVGGQSMDVIWSEYAYSLDGTPSTDRFAVSTDFGGVIELRSDGGYAGVARDVRLASGADQSALMRNPERLGECRTLLSQVRE